MTLKTEKRTLKLASAPSYQLLLHTTGVTIEVRPENAEDEQMVSEDLLPVFGVHHEKEILLLLAFF